MTDQYYTHSVWHVKPGQEEAFEAAWLALGAVFGGLEQPPGRGTLLRGIEGGPYVSFGPWPSLEAIQAMRADPEAQAGIERLMQMCDDATPSAFRVVARPDGADLS